jgi:hypothetical protein
MANCRGSVPRTLRPTFYGWRFGRSIRQCCDCQITSNTKSRIEFHQSAEETGPRFSDRPFLIHRTNLHTPNGMKTNRLTPSEKGTSISSISCMYHQGRIPSCSMFNPSPTATATALEIPSANKLPRFRSATCNPEHTNNNKIASSIKNSAAAAFINTYRHDQQNLPAEFPRATFVPDVTHDRVMVR